MTVQLYRIELTEQVAAFWQEALQQLTPDEVRQGFLKYTQSDRCQFPPKPGDIIEKSGWVKPFVDMRDQEAAREKAYLERHWQGDTDPHLLCECGHPLHRHGVFTANTCLGMPVDLTLIGSCGCRKFTPQPVASPQNPTIGSQVDGTLHPGTEYFKSEPISPTSDNPHGFPMPKDGKLLPHKFMFNSLAPGRCSMCLLSENDVCHGIIPVGRK